MPPRRLTAEQQAQLADLALTLAHGNPASRKAFAATVREAAKDPSLAPHVQPFLDDLKDTIDPVPAVVDPKTRPLTQADLDARLQEDEGKRRTARENEAQQQQRQTLIDSGRFTADSMTKLESFMEENGYSNYEHAAVIYAHQNPPEQGRPTIGASHVWEMPKGDVIKDPKKTALNRAYQVVDEIRRARA